MEFEVEITRNDYKEALKYADKTHHKKYYTIFFVLYIPFFLILNYKHIFNFGYIFYQFLIFTIFILAFTLLMRPLWFIVFQYLPQKNGAILGKHKFKISDEGFWESTEHNANLTKWSGIRSLENNKKYIFLFVDSNMAHVIPRRYFKSEEDTRYFCDALRSRVPAIANNLSIN